MPNVSPKCGICNFIQSLEDGPNKDQLILDLNSKHEIKSSQMVELLAAQGFGASASTVRECRRNGSIPVTSQKEKASLTTPSSPPEKLPPGWENFAEYAGTIGKAGIRLPRPYSTRRDLLVASGFNPDEWQIAGTVNTRKWMRHDQEWLYYYKFDVVAGESPEVVEQHVDELVDLIRSKPREKQLPIANGEDAFVFAISDWQIGKKEGNDGTPQTIERVVETIEMAVERVLELRAQGHLMPTLFIPSLGDMGEGTCGFYPGQQFLIDRNRRDQGRINRELITRAIDRLSPLFDRTVVAVVGGNHGENRSPEGKRITSDGDNDDCAYFDAVKEAFDRSGRTDIDWHIMEDELSMAVTVGGVPIGLTHGHLFQKGSSAQMKAYEWWKSQDFGFQAVRGTRILLSAHFHHFSATTFGARTHLQTPAMDPGSKWFREMGGQDSPPGTLTFRLDASSVLGWEDLSILHPTNKS